MTLRRYYADSYTREFTARVTETPLSNGVPAAVLDETFFYPSSGGQPHDTGRLGSAAVVDVAIRQDGAVLHLLDTPVPEGPLDAALDWPRRFDHMQQHTGQHILSEAFIRVAGAPTIGFHLGADSVSIDVAAGALGDSAVAQAAALANEVVTGNAPVRAWFPEPDELRGLTLRKTPEVDGAFRVVAIGDFDLSACGGTHVARTGEVGLIEILKTERAKGGTRVEFLTGGRARQDYARKHALIRELCTSLTCSAGELAGSVARLSAALADARHQLSVYRERDLDTEAASLRAAAKQSGPLRIVRGAWSERPMDDIKGLALRVTSVPATVCLLGAAGSRAQVIFGRSEDVSLDMRPAFDQALQSLGGGKGGGTRLLQGAAAAADLPALERALELAEAQLGGAPP